MLNFMQSTSSPIPCLSLSLPSTASMLLPRSLFCCKITTPAAVSSKNPQDAFYHKAESAKHLDKTDESILKPVLSVVIPFSPGTSFRYS